VQHSIPRVAVLFIYNHCGNVEQMQRKLHGVRVLASDLVNPDCMPAKFCGVDAAPVLASDAGPGSLAHACGRQGLAD
jgi:hypothetical protein